MADAVSFARYEPVGEAVRRAEAGSTPVWVRGGGTLQTAPLAEVEVVDLRAHSDLVTHNRDDMTIAAQAGMTVAALQTVLGAAGQQLPLDVPFADRTTIGGLIATKLAGSRRFSRGGVRDLLLGVTIVGRGGEVFRGGGRVVKNVAGYDLCKLYTGAWGWLGAIVEATLRVVPRPESSAAIAMRFSDAAAIEEKIASLLTGTLQPASIDVLSETAAAALELPGAGFTLLVGFEGLREEVAEQMAAGGNREQLRGASVTPLSMESYEQYCRRAVEITLDAPLTVRLSVPSAAVAGVVSTIAVGAPTTRIVAHAADGVVWAGFAAGTAEAAKRACETAAAVGGGWMLPRGETDINMPMIGPSREDWGLMRRVKAALDPANVFGRGSPFDLSLRDHNPDR